MRTTCLSCAVLLLAISPAGAETLYNQDGVRLSATVQEIDPGGATCRVREERHSAEEYARLQPNHGQPLNVWRVELVVANYSGKALDYLSAHLNVESAWPPCDHWDGPDRGYGKPVVWTGPLMTIQDVGSVEPGEERREIEFVLAWHEADPALGRWDIDYDFEAGASAAAAAAGAERPAPAGTDAQGERTAGRQVAPEPTCAGMEVGSSCWMEIENNPGCYIWNSYLGRDQTVTWTGGCAGGLANGAGSRTWSYTGDDGEPTSESGTGELRDGKANGRWTLRFASGNVFEGPYVDGKANGRWTLRFASGNVSEGPFVDGERHGRWTLRFADGTVSEGPFEDGKRHGHWTLRFADGGVEEGPFEDGKRHGHWTLRFADGGVEEGPYVDGEKNGHWTLRYPSGDVREGPYVDGKRNGHWTTRFANGTVTEGPYVDDGKHGRWTWRWADGRVMYDCYSNGDDVDC